MKKLRILILLTVFLLGACGNFNNPISSENSDQVNQYNDTIIYSTSGGSDQG